MRSFAAALALAILLAGVTTASAHAVTVAAPPPEAMSSNYPSASMLPMLAVYRIGLVLASPAVTQKFPPEARRAWKPEAVVGCGPFKLVEWVQGSHLVMDRFD